MAKVLIVDDARIMRHHIRNILKELGHTIIAEADSGYDGIQKYKSSNPDIVIMDIDMPAINGIKDGIDAVKKIKEFDKNAKIIMFTSHGEEEKVKEAIQQGAKSYLLKPTTAASLGKVLIKLGF